MEWEFKVPQLGEKLFIVGEYENKSYVDKSSPLEKISLYVKGYKDSADKLVDETITSHSNHIKDSSVFPIIFLYRHYIELRLKEIYLRFDENPDNKNLDHNLLDLWKKAKPLIKKANNPSVESVELEQTLKATEDYISQYAEKDLNSFVFRYPFAKSKKADDELKSYFDDEFHIDLLHLKERMHELECLLYGTVAQLEAIEETQQQLLADQDNNY